MKKPFYLVGLAALALVGCSDNDFFSGGPDDNFGQASKGQLAFGISDGSGKTTRGEITGEKAAEKLNKKFTVYGWKQVNNKSGATAAFEDVFQDYVVKWEGLGSAGTTESNSRGWEYVGYQSEPVNGTPPYDQTIKYWDWSTDRYDFIAWSIANVDPEYKSNAQVLERPTVNNMTNPKLSAPGLTFFAPTAKDLGGVFVSDKFTSVPLSEAPHLINTTSSWTDGFEGLANVNTHPYPTAHRGLYSQMGTNVTASNQEEGIVYLQFRNLAAKARIGIYETIPGYKVSNVVFYRKDDAEGGPTKYQHTWSVTDANGDYNANQSFATLYAKDATPANAEIFARRGEISVKYHDTYYNAEGTEKDNVAYTAVEGTDKQSYFAFGKLTNERGSNTWIDNNPIGVTSNTASMSIGNDADKLYTYVFPMETNDHVLNLKVNYLLTSIDGSGEQIRVTGANAVVPVEFAKWKPNYAYTYLFKISDNTNGYTNPDLGPAGLYPITFDACLVNTEDGMQQTITTVNDKSITTYQNGQQVTENSEYRKADADATTKTDRIYFTVEGNEGTNSLLTLNTTAGATQNVWLYTAWAPEGTLITEEAVANYKANNIVLTDVTSNLDITETEAPNKSGAQYSIKFTSGTAASFEPIAKYYVVKAAYTDAAGTGTMNYITYKVIKVKDGDAAKKYALTWGTNTNSIPNDGTTTFTINNAPEATVGASLVEGKVTGAKGAIKIYDGTSDVTNLFTISEDDAYTYTIKANGAPGNNYTVKLEGMTDATLEVAAPVWSVSSINIEENTSKNVTLNASASGPALSITPTVTPAAGAKGTLDITETSGTYTITPSKGAVGTFTVSYNGASFTVQVDNYTLTATSANGSLPIINIGDADTYKKATITLANGNASGTEVNGKDLTLGTPSYITQTSLTTNVSNKADITANAASTGVVTGNTEMKFTYNHASCTVEVVNFSLTNGTKVDGVETIVLKKDGVALDGATFETPAGVKVQATTTAGVYKVTGSGTVIYKYKNVKVADVVVPAP